MCSPLDDPGDLAQMRPRQRLALGLGSRFLQGSKPHWSTDEDWKRREVGLKWDCHALGRSSEVQKTFNPLESLLGPLLAPHGPQWVGRVWRESRGHRTAGVWRSVS